MICRIHNIAFNPFNKKTTEINSLKARKLSTKLLIRNEEKKFHTHNKINKIKFKKNIYTKLSHCVKAQRKRISMKRRFLAISEFFFQYSSSSLLYAILLCIKET